VLLADLVTASDRVASTRSRLAKREVLVDLLRRLGSEEAPVAVSFLMGRPRQDRLGVGYATVLGVEVEPASSPSIEVIEVDRVLGTIAGLSGPGSRAAIEAALADLLGRATESEQRFLRGMILRNLRQGALDGIMVEAVADALGVGADSVRRAAMLEGDLVAVASRALVEGPESLGVSRLQVMTPVQPMLARTASTAGEAVAGIGEALVEWKLDGARVQVHRRGSEVRVFTRNLRDVSHSVPELVSAAARLEADSFILDGEALLMGDDGSPLGFQDSISSFSTESGEPGRPPLAVYFFDLLHLDGQDLVDSPLAERREALARVAPVVGSIVTDEPAEADRFFEQAVESGFEGVVVKDLTQPYEAGRRGASWVKVKPTHTLDLVVLAAEWGSGRRQGWLSNLHLGARDPDGGFVMLGKTFKGLTDEMLAWQTSRFLEIEDHRDRHIVFLRPEIVYEIAFDGVQRSTRYPGGVALRFARVKRYRDDKGPQDADTIETVRRFAR
jgi:DNA ligase-1